MRKILPLLFLVVCSCSFAQTILSKPLVCTDTKDLVKQLQKTFEEEPVFTGKDSQPDTASRFVVFVNQKTKTFTIVEYLDEIACILGAGKNAEISNKLFKNYD